MLNLQKVIYIGFVIGFEQTSFQNKTFKAITINYDIARLTYHLGIGIISVTVPWKQTQQFFDNVTFILFMSDHPDVMLCNFSLL